MADPSHPTRSNQIEPSNVERKPAYERRFPRDNDDPDARDLFGGIAGPELKHIIQESLVEVSDGPYPPPQFVRSYNDHEPGLGTAIARAGIDRVQATTKIDLEESASRIRIAERGQWIAFALVIAVLTVVVILAALEYPTAATILGTTTVISLAIVFVGSTSIEKIARMYWLRSQGGEPDNRKDQNNTV